MKRQEQIPYGDTLEGRGENRPFFASARGKTVSGMLMIVIVILVLVIMNSRGDVLWEMDDSQLAVACLQKTPVFIEFDSITSVSEIGAFDMGSPVRVEDWDQGWCGIYENSRFGKYTLYAYTSTDTFIVVEYNSGVLVFNGKTERETHSAYSELAEKAGLL